METLISINISEKLQILQDKENRLKDKITMASRIKDDNSRHRDRYRSGSSRRDYIKGKETP
jgi:hypothetical protein